MLSFWSRSQTHKKGKEHLWQGLPPLPEKYPYSPLKLWSQYVSYSRDKNEVYDEGSSITSLCKNKFLPYPKTVKRSNSPTAHCVAQFKLSPISSAYLLHIIFRIFSTSALSSFSFLNQCLSVFSSFFTPPTAPSSSPSRLEAEKWNLHTENIYSKQSLRNLYISNIINEGKKQLSCNCAFQIRKSYNPFVSSGKISKVYHSELNNLNTGKFLFLLLL